MSLTSVIPDDDHPLTRWLAAHLRRTAAVRASYASAFPVRRVQRPVAAGRTVVRWDLLGVAVDFRLRCAFVAPQPPPSAVAGAALAGTLGEPESRRVGEALVDEYVEHLLTCGPYVRGRRWLLEREVEARLNRMCFALAWFDRVFRDGAIAPGSPLAGTVGGGDLDALLAYVPDYAVMDLQVQVKLAERALGWLRDATDVAVCRAAPTFAGSGDVGGADADLVVDRCLVEIKSTSRPENLTDRAIWQLAGYVLLDYDDEYRFDEVAFYMSRVGWLATWGVDEFFGLLGARSSLHQLRDEFAQQCAAAGSATITGVDGHGVRRDRSPKVNLVVADRQEGAEPK
ncbi:hypothetical protein [Micromonospora sp. NBRC 110037]|uniref:hypothetical protein n=1 Tax=Micromonospora sp. NBRC 110037 TaxID=1621261 RepID=UPI0012FAD798|nr:hypothetical protein [Micromonospora sp. NBRC 110037]